MPTGNDTAANAYAFRRGRGVFVMEANPSREGGASENRLAPMHALFAGTVVSTEVAWQKC